MAASGHFRVRQWAVLIGREWALSCPPVGIFSCPPTLDTVGCLGGTGEDELLCFTDFECAASSRPALGLVLKSRWDCAPLSRVFAGPAWTGIPPSSASETRRCLMGSVYRPSLGALYLVSPHETPPRSEHGVTVVARMRTW